MTIKELVWYRPPELSPRTIQKILELCAIDERKAHAYRLLDFGCGEGRYLRLFADHVPRQNLIGTEVIPDRVKALNEEGFTCLQLSEEHSVLPFGSDYFEIVFSSNVIEHIPRPLYQNYLREIHRVLKPGGRFVVGTPNYPVKRLYDLRKAFITEYKRYYLFDDPTHCNKLSIYLLEKDLQQFFQLVHLEPTRFFLEGKLKFLQHPKVRHRLRILGDKIVGYAIK